MDLLGHGTLIFLFIHLTASSSDANVTIGTTFSLSEFPNESSSHPQSRHTAFSTHLDIASTSVIDSSRYVASVRHSTVPSQIYADDTMSSVDSAAGGLQPTTAWITDSTYPSNSESSKMSEHISSTSPSRVLEPTSTILVSGSESRMLTHPSTVLSFQSTTGAESSSSTPIRPAIDSLLATSPSETTSSVILSTRSSSSHPSLTFAASPTSATNVISMPSSRTINTPYVSQSSEYVSTKVLSLYDESNHLSTTSPLRTIHPSSMSSSFSEDETSPSIAHHSKISADPMQLSTLSYASSIHSSQESSSLLSPFSHNRKISSDILPLSTLSYQSSIYSSQESSSLLSPFSPHSESSDDHLQQTPPLQLSTLSYTSSMYSSHGSDSLLSSFSPRPLPSSSLWESSAETVQKETIREEGNSSSIMLSSATSVSEAPRSFPMQSETVVFSLSTEKKSDISETEYSSFQSTMGVQTPQSSSMLPATSVYLLSTGEGSDISENEHSSFRSTRGEESSPPTLLPSASSVYEMSGTLPIQDITSVSSSPTEEISDISEMEHSTLKSSLVSSQTMMNNLLSSDLFLGQETTPPVSDVLSTSMNLASTSINEQIPSTTEFESFSVASTTFLTNLPESALSTEAENISRTSSLVDVWTSQPNEAASITDLSHVEFSTGLIQIESSSMSIFTPDITSFDTTRVAHSSFGTSDGLGSSVLSSAGSTLEKEHSISTHCFQCVSSGDLGRSRIFSQTDSSYTSLFETSLQSQTKQSTYTSSASDFSRSSISQGVFIIASSTARLVESSGLVESLSSSFSFSSPSSLNEKDFSTSVLYMPNTTVMSTPIQSTQIPYYKTYKNLTLVFSFRGDCKLITGNTFIFRKFWRALLKYTERASNMTTSQHDMSLVEMGCDPFHAVVSISVINTVNIAKIMDNYFHSNASHSKIFIRLNNGTELVVTITHYEFTPSSSGYQSNAERSLSEIVVICFAAVICGVLIAIGLIISIREYILKRKSERFRFDARGLHEARSERVALKRLPSSKSDLEMQDNGSLRGSPFDAEYSTISSNKTKKTNFMTQADMNNSNGSLSKKRGRKSSNTAPSSSSSNGTTNSQSHRGYGLVIGLLGYKIKSSEPAATYAVPDKKAKVQGLSIRSVGENSAENTLPRDKSRRTNQAPDSSPTPPPRHLRTVPKNKEATASGERLVPKSTKVDDARTEGVANPAFIGDDKKDDVTGSTDSVLI